VDPELLSVLQKGLFTVLDTEGQRVCCSFFVTDAGVALTVRHGHDLFLQKPDDTVHAVMLREEPVATPAAATNDADIVAAPDEVLLKFRVHSFSPETELDYTCLILTHALPAGTFQPLPIPAAALPINQLIGKDATLLPGSIAYNRMFKINPSPSLYRCTVFTAHPQCVLYSSSTFCGDSCGNGH
jgi:hypothetical protein